MGSKGGHEPILWEQFPAYTLVYVDCQKTAKLIFATAQIKLLIMYELIWSFNNYQEF